MIKLHNKCINIGTHHKYYDNLSTTILDSIDIGDYGLSFDLGHNRNYTRKRIDIEDLIMCAGLVQRFPMNIYSIIPQMYNLCGSKKILAWNGNVKQDKHTLHIIEEIEYELDTLAKLKGSVMIQLGAYINKTNGLKSVAQTINKIDFRPDTRLTLVNSLNSHYNLGITLNDLSSVYNSIVDECKKHVSIAIDTTLLFVNGIYDISTKQGIDELFKDYDMFFDIPLSVIIITDCETAYDSKEYEYAPIGKGMIWKDIDVLYYLVNECCKRKINILTKTIDDTFVLQEIKLLY